MDKLSPFQLVLLIGCVIAAVSGVVLFALGVGPQTKDAVGPVVIWGMVPKEGMATMIEQIRLADERFAEVSYVQKDSRTYISDFVDALAAGRGPDLFLLYEDDLYAQQDKLYFIPPDYVSVRQFKDAFAEAGEVYLAPAGAAGLPLLIDPLVMYWNRDIFSDAGLSEPPRYWDELFTMGPKVTERDQSSNILRSFIAFGEYRNIKNAKDILAALILQTGNPIIFKDVSSGAVRSVLSSDFDQPTSPAEAALRFYTQFSDPTRAVYSWNRALTDSRQSFLAGDLALYVGFASEYAGLHTANPNLNFDVVMLPQSRDADRKSTFGHVLAAAVPRGAANPTGAIQTAVMLSMPEQVGKLSQFMSLPPARRDLLRVEPSGPASAVFYTSAVYARSWLDPNDTETEGVFQRMIESFLSGRLRLHESIKVAGEELEKLLAQ